MLLSLRCRSSPVELSGPLRVSMDSDSSHRVQSSHRFAMGNSCWRIPWSGSTILKPVLLCLKGSRSKVEQDIYIQDVILGWCTEEVTVLPESASGKGTSEESASYNHMTERGEHHYLKPKDESIISWKGIDTFYRWLLLVQILGLICAEGSGSASTANVHPVLSYCCMSTTPSASIVIFVARFRDGCAFRLSRR